MTEPGSDTNLQIYEKPEVASHYATLHYLTACERMLFESYVAPGSTILDLGVGGGRTTPYLSSRASKYVGVDYSAAMVKACQAKFPGLEFMVADAADLSGFADGVFDAVVFAFNGIDYVVPERSRRNCLQHIHRVLKGGGVLIFSSHNPRAVLSRRAWNRERLQALARKLSAGWKVAYWPVLGLLNVARASLAFCQASAATLVRAVRRIPTRAFWRGEGSLVDPVHGGLLTHYWTPRWVIEELQGLPLRPERILGDDYPRPSRPFTTDWYYYVFSKPCEK